MAERKTKVLFQGNMVDGEEVDFEPLKEPWNEYQCSDGAVVRLKVVASKIVHVVGEVTASGEPVYAVQATTLVSVVAPSRKN